MPDVTSSFIGLFELEIAIDVGSVFVVSQNVLSYPVSISIQLPRDLSGINRAEAGICRPG